MLLRRSRRMINVALSLQKAGLLPEGDVSTPQARKHFFHELDENMFDPKLRAEQPDTLLYVIRALALEKELALHAVGRAFYHLAQRRGFLSNRKATARDKK